MKELFRRGIIFSKGLIIFREFLQVRVIYYTDELNDDFSPTNGKIRQKVIDKNYTYLPGNPLWRIFSFILYRLIATPVAFLFNKIGFGVRIKNRKALKKIKTGYFLYGNHTQIAADAFNPTIITFPKKANILVNPDAVSIPVVGKVVSMLGGMPLPSTKEAAKIFLNAIKKKIEKGQVITIYPESHIWPYYNKIRPFTDASFKYPFMFNAPAVGFTVTYRQRKIFKKLPPLITVTVSEPVYPKECGSKTEMRDRIYGFMVQTVEKEKSCEYIKYIKKEKAYK